MDNDEGTIRAHWEEVLKRRNCMEIYGYLYDVILSNPQVGDYTLDRRFIVRLLKIAKESDLPCEQSPYENLRQDIDHYIEVFSKDAT
ncbi:MAG: hypothetical protein EHM14_10205 [Methanothrix sp.]|nr:MAG: hypothetical protein EHM14_10205 [Methanothrix sp.]